VTQRKDASLDEQADRLRDKTWGPDDVRITKPVPMTDEEQALLAEPPPTGYPQARE
jgi:hypothetical protein